MNRLIRNSGLVHPLHKMADCQGEGASCHTINNGILALLLLPSCSDYHWGSRGRVKWILKIGQYRNTLQPWRKKPKKNNKEKQVAVLCPSKVRGHLTFIQNCLNVWFSVTWNTPWTPSRRKAVCAVWNKMAVLSPDLNPVAKSQNKWFKSYGFFFVSFLSYFIRHFEKLDVLTE